MNVPNSVATSVAAPATIDAATMTLPEQLSTPRLLLLFLVPGALMTLAFVLLAPVVERLGFPPIAALLLAIVGVLIPIELGVVLWAGRAAGSVRAAIPYRVPMRLVTWLWLVPVLILAAFLGFGIHQLIEPWLIGTFFAWLPQWYVTPISMDHVVDYSTHGVDGDPGRVPRDQRVRRPDRGGAVLPRLPAAAHGADGPLGAARQRQPVLAVPLLVAVAAGRPDPRVRADGLRRPLEAEHLPRDGRPLQPEHDRGPARREPRSSGGSERGEQPRLAR